MARPSLTPERVEAYRQELLAKHTDVIRRFLRDGENLRGIALPMIDSSVKRVPWRYLRKNGLFARILDISPSDWLGDGFFAATDRLASGQAMSGGWESQAGRFVIAVAAADSQPRTKIRHLCLAVTGSRVLVLTQPSPFGLRPIELLAEYSQGDIKIRPGSQPPKGNNRVEVAFSDGSWVALSGEVSANGPTAAALIAHLLS